jgi:hypothetical protein
MVDYAKLRVLPLSCIPDPKVDQRTRDQAAHAIGAGMATSAEIASYLRVSDRLMPMLLQTKKLTCNRAGRFTWEQVWNTLWHIPQVPPEQYQKMKIPLLDVTDVAERAGVCERSVLRDGNRKAPRYGLPRHIQLSKRVRRYHPSMIFLWEIDEALEDWMQPVRSKMNRRRGLRVVDNYVKPP